MEDEMMKKSYQLSNHIEIPVFGLGTWQLGNEECEQVVQTGLKAGYRHIDTAQLYENEEGVGKAMKNSGLKREEIFLTTKIADSIKDYESVKQSIEASLQKLQTDYIDLLLIHSPRPFEEMFEYAGKDYFKENLEVWKAMEEYYEAGKIKAIGVSNFQEEDLDNLIENAKIKPMVNQILCNITHYPKQLIEKCAKEDILVEAYSPNATGKLKSKELEDMAARYGYSLPQLANRFDYQLGLVVLPRSRSKNHMIENMNVSVPISKEDMEYLSSLGVYTGWKGADSE
jgi:diketogulonate reductase-like aldo/keto reductase